MRHPVTLRAKGFFVLIACALLTLAGCRHRVSSDAYLKRYEPAMQVTENSGDFAVTAMALNPEYLVAREMDSTWSQAQIRSARETYEKAFYVSVQVRLKNPTGGVEDFQKDFVNGSMIQGDDVYRRRLQFLQNEVGACVRLNCGNGVQLPPASYRFTRGVGLPGVHTFLFLFPKTYSGRPVSIRGAELVLKDMGLGPEPLRLHLQTENPLSLKT